MEDFPTLALTRQQKKYNFLTGLMIVLGALVLLGLAVFFYYSSISPTGWEGTAQKIVFTDTNGSMYEVKVVNGHFKGLPKIVTTSDQHTLLEKTVVSDSTTLSACEEGRCEPFFTFGIESALPPLFATDNDFLLLKHPASGELQSFTFSDSVFSFQPYFSVPLSGFPGLEFVGIASKKDNLFIMGRTDSQVKTASIHLCLVHIPKESADIYMESCISKTVSPEFADSIVHIFPYSL